jgi:hypothetical protein
MHERAKGRPTSRSGRPAANHVLDPTVDTLLAQRQRVPEPARSAGSGRSRWGDGAALRAVTFVSNVPDGAGRVRESAGKVS